MERCLLLRNDSDLQVGVDLTQRPRSTLSGDKAQLAPHTLCISDFAFGRKRLRAAWRPPRETWVYPGSELSLVQKLPVDEKPVLVTERTVPCGHLIQRLAKPTLCWFACRNAHMHTCTDDILRERRGPWGQPGCVLGKPWSFGTPAWGTL